MVKECFRLVREYRNDSKNSGYSIFIPTGNRTNTITDPVMDGQHIMPAHQRQLSRIPNREKVEILNAKLKWNEAMRKKVPGFKKRKYKYITIMKIEG